MRFSFLHHAVDLILRQGRSTGNGHRLFLACATILCGDVHDAVGVDVEGDLDLRLAARCRGDAAQFEGSQQLVVAGELALTLVDLNQHGCLAVFRCGEQLRGLRRNRGVTFDQLGHEPALGFNAEGQRGHVDEQNVLTVALDDAGLQGCADCHNFVGVDTLVRFATVGQLADLFSHCRHTGGATDQHNVVNVGDLDTCVTNHVVERLLRAVKQIRGHFLELGARKRFVQVDRTVSRHRQVLQ